MGKKVTISLTLVLLAALSALIADSVNLFVGQSLEASARKLPVVTPSLSAIGPVKDPLAATIIVEGNIFNSKLRGRKTEEVKDVRPVSFPPPRPTELKITLVGTVVGDSQSSYAVIEDQVTQEQGLFRLGEMVPGGGILTRIERSRVTLLRGGEREILQLSDPVLSRSPQSPPVSIPTPSSTESSGGVRKISDTRWALDKREVEGNLSNLPQLLTKARVIPNFTAGKPDGFKIFAIVPDSFYSKIGLQNGDILQRINGIEVKDPENFIRVFQQLKDETHITVDLVRNAQKATFEYEIR